MRSNYKKIGDFIQLVDERNKNLKVTTLLGLSITKEFIQSVANTIGTDMENYKIIRKNQFACSTMQVRRDKKIPVALLKDHDEAIISPAYPVFEITDTSKLVPEYLMMWMSRTEFDREACFYAIGGVRGSLEWVDFCDMKLPVPSIDKQKEIIKEYNILVNRITLNNQLNQKLEETAQAIYKQWFVDFEFPDENGKPYKSNGGEMFESEMGEIPKGWKVGTLNDIVEIIDGDRGEKYPSQEDFSSIGYCLFLNAGNVTKIGFNFSTNSFVTKEKDKELRKGRLTRNDVVMTTRGTVGNVGYFGTGIPFENIRINSGMVIIRSKYAETSIFVFLLLRSEYMRNAIDSYISGSAQPQLPIKDIVRIPILIPTNGIVKKASNLFIRIQGYSENLNIEKNLILNSVYLILSKLAQIV